MRSSSEEPTRRHVPAEQVRRALLDAGRALLFERGVEPGLGRVSLKDAIARAEVPRSSAYRIFSGERGPLETFRIELLADLEDTVDADATHAASERMLDEHAERINSGDPREMAFALRQIIRIALETNVESVAASNEWHVFMSSMAAAGFESQRDPRLVEMHQVSAENRNHRFIPLFQALSSLFGLRLRAPFTWADFASVNVLAIDSAALRFELEPRLRELPRATGADGEVELWSAAAIAFEGAVLTLLEPDPEVSVSANLATWIEPTPRTG